MIIEHAHLAISRIRAIRLDISAGGLWRTDIEIQHRLSHGLLLTTAYSLSTDRDDQGKCPVGG